MSVLRVCPVCGSPLEEKSGKFGGFYRCLDFPECSYAERSTGDGDPGLKTGAAKPRSGALPRDKGSEPPSVKPSTQSLPRPGTKVVVGETLKKREGGGSLATTVKAVSETSGALEVWTPAETSKFLKISKHKLMRMRQTGEGPPFSRFGKAIRYERQEVIQWIAVLRQKSNGNMPETVGSHAFIGQGS